MHLEVHGIDQKISPQYRMAAESWDDGLRSLLIEDVILGYGLIQVNGRVQCAFGNAQDLLLDASGNGEATDAAKELQAVMTADAVREALTVGGTELFILRKEDDALYALSEGKVEGLMAYTLKIGILIVRFGRPRIAQVVVPQVEKAVAGLRKA